MAENKKECTFMQHKQCEWFPCHKVENTEDFNCTFCFCPLYYLDECIGDYTYTKKGIKDCSNCAIPHLKENYDLIIDCIKKHNEKRSEKMHE